MRVVNSSSQAFYGIIAICITALIIAALYLTAELDRYKMELVIECIYARGEFEDSVSKCIGDVNTILNWERSGP